MKANYIDVMNPNNNKKPNVPANVPPLIDPAATAPVNNFFIPAPGNFAYVIIRFLRIF